MKPLVLVLFFGAIFSANAGNFSGQSLDEPLVKPQGRPLVVLVPGTGNSFFNQKEGLGAYFSDTVRASIQTSGYDFLTIQNLIPFGGFEENGDLVYQQVQAWYSQNDSKYQKPVVFFGHSAGGFYALWAAHRFAGSSLRPTIQNLLFLSTPLQGALLANRVLENPMLRSTLESMSENFSCFLNVNGLMQVRSETVVEFLNRLTLPDETVLVSFAGMQKPPQRNFFGALKWWEWTSAYFLAPVFQTISQWLQVDSDGVVDLVSASASGVKMRKESGRWEEVIPFTEWVLPLDHPEQVLDFRIFGALGTQNADWIDQVQRKYYPMIIDNGLRLYQNSPR